MIFREPGRGEETLFFEQQSASKTWWPWIFIPVALYLFIQFGYGLYSQLILGRPFGRPPLPDGWLAALSLAMFALGLALIWGAFKIKLKVTVTPQRLYLHYYPFLKRSFEYSQILAARSLIYRPLLEYGGWGLRWSFKDRGRGYTISGNRGVKLELAFSKPVLIGSARPQELAEVLSKRITPA